MGIPSVQRTSDIDNGKRWYAVQQIAVHEEVPQELEPAALEAARTCPEQAITLS
jgi:ferredoxin